MAQLVRQQVPQAYSAAVAITSGIQGYQVSNAAAGIALITPATTGNHPTLWNPSNSGVYASIRSLTLSYVSGTNAPTAVEWATTAATGASIGTGLPIVTFTQVTYGTQTTSGSFTPTYNGFSAGTAKCLWSPAVNTYTVLPTYWRPTGLSLATMAANSTPAPFTIKIDYMGTLGIAPGVALSLCTQAATTTALFQVCIEYDEIAIGI